MNLRFLMLLQCLLPLHSPGAAGLIKDGLFSSTGNFVFNTEADNVGMTAMSTSGIVRNNGNPLLPTASIITLVVFL